MCCGIKGKIKIEKTTGPINECIGAYMELLRSFLQQFLAYQREHPDKYISSMVIPHKKLSHNADMMTNIIWGSFSNCCFWPNSGKEIFINSDDGNPHLMMHFDFKHGEFEQRFDESSVSKEFVHVETCYRDDYYDNRLNVQNFHDHYYIDCGEDLDMALFICAKVLKDVFFDIELEKDDDFSITCTVDDKQKIEVQAKEHAKAETLLYGLLTNRIIKTWNMHCTSDSNEYMLEAFEMNEESTIDDISSIDLSESDFLKLISPEAYDEAQTKVRAVENNFWEREYIPIERCRDIYMNEFGKVIQMIYQCQRHNPDWLLTSEYNLLSCNLDTYYGIFDDAIHDMFTFSNCCFLPTGDEVFPGTLHDGKIHLMMKLTFYESGEQMNIDLLDRFMKSSLSTEFVHVRYRISDVEIVHYFYTDFGENIYNICDAIRVIFKDVLYNADVCGTYFLALLFQDKIRAQRALRDWAKVEKYEIVRPLFPNVYMNAIYERLMELPEKIIEYQRKSPDIRVDVGSFYCTYNIRTIQKNAEELMLNTLCKMLKNCCFLPQSGEEVFPGTLYDGTPHLMFELCFKEEKRAMKSLFGELEELFLNRFLNSSFSENFTHVCIPNDDNETIEHHFYAD